MARAKESRLVTPIEGDSLALSDGSLLLHIGPPKTGTTAIQNSLFQARDALAVQGVHYAGRTAHSRAAVHAVTERQTVYFAGGGQIDIGVWKRLVVDTHRHNSRIVALSSEGFASATPERIVRIVDDLGGQRVHVVVTLRPLSKIVPSQWQQSVQSGSRTSFPDWLEHLLAHDPRNSNASFWYRHRHDELVRRWADVVGADRITIAVVDDRDHHSLLRTFEGLAGLVPFTLAPVVDRSNRSLSFAEAEGVRALNALVATEGLTPSDQATLVRFGVAPYVKELPVAVNNAPILFPGWAADRLDEISSQVVTELVAGPWRVVGDVQSLLQSSGDRPGDIAQSADVPPAVAARIALGIAFGPGKVARPGREKDGSLREPLGLRAVPTSALTQVLASRLFAATSRRLRRSGRELAAGPTVDLRSQHRSEN